MANKILGACIGNCVHVAGIINFLRLAQNYGYETEFLGSAISVKNFVNAIKNSKPDLAVVSYRLTPETAQTLFNELKNELKKHNLEKTRLAFGGTTSVAKVARENKLFEAVFSGAEPIQTIINYLQKKSGKQTQKHYAQTLVERIRQNYPYPLLRHHLGLKTVRQTIIDARKIALARVLDIISIAPDQNAQEFFFKPKHMPKTGHGAGGVPLRKPPDLRAIYQATRCGNYPLVRCYAGTDHLLDWSKMSVKTINIAWGAIPLFWYNELDKRSTRDLLESIKENQATIRWYAKHKIPVEVNDSHQWSLRDSHDALAVATAYLAAYNAKKLGVRHYVSQYMFNTPPETSPQMDLAKMLAKIELIESLHDQKFTSFREVRTGLRSMPTDPDIAKGHLSASVLISMMLKPQIMHVVGYCEANYNATAQEIIESAQITHGVIRLALKNLPDITYDPAIQKRKSELIKQANLIINAIKRLSRKPTDPLTDPEVLYQAVRNGILDAPHLVGSNVAQGKIITAPVNGQYLVINPQTGKPMTEAQRLKSLVKKGR
ncbi:MAG: cobalamin-dependent protein [Candidatus Latescibacteria bacterium]|nr:cobalamin-dependent protein [Candidatus Latescibacterota bacterium]